MKRTVWPSRAALTLIGLGLARLLLAADDAPATAPNLLWYGQPAAKWTEAAPLGNGRLGAMVFGGVEHERLQLNEDTLVSDEPGYRTLPLNVRQLFATVTNLIAQRRFAEADTLVTREWLGRSWACYQPLGDLRLDFEHATNAQNYRRELDLDNALCRVSYRAGGVKFTREIFASRPDEVIVIRLTADKPGSIGFQARLTSPHSNAVARVETKTSSPLPSQREKNPTAIELRNLRTNGILSPALSSKGGEGEEVAERPNSTAVEKTPSPTGAGAQSTGLIREFLVLHGQGPGLVLRRTLAWVESRGETWKYPEIWDKNGKRLPQASQALYGKDIGGRGTFFDARLMVQAKGGKVTTSGDTVVVSGADEVTLLLSAATSYNGFDKSPSREGVDAGEKAAAFLAAALKRHFADLRARHTRDYGELFGRVKLNLGAATTQSALPTDQRLKQFGNGQDPALPALYFQFGRYLMISGSRPGGQPLNLQGLWNEEIIPPWASQYTININTEMNYWPVEVCNLSECAEPLLRMVRELAVDGRRVAHDMYGRRGWVAHHNTTLWRDAQPVDNAAVSSYWPMGSGWLCQAVFEHYRFTGDREFLRREAYPLLKGASEFYLDWLVSDGKGQLTTPVSTSPENTFSYTNAQGTVAKASVASGTAADLAIIRDLFANTLAAAEDLKADPKLQAEIKAALSKLRPYQIGSKGQLLEWQEEFGEPDPQHRHLSHLFGLHPGREITPRGSPELAAAARRSLELRGDGGTGWSKAWKVSLWARLEAGDHAFKMLSELISKSTQPNMFDTCPPFQIDGNFGGCAGIAEMLVQSQAGEIELLPALPKAWPSGQVTGLRARGGFQVDVTWKDGQVSAYRIAAEKPQSVKVRVNGEVKPVIAEQL